MYVTDDTGQRIGCQHPGEMWTVNKVLGENAPRELIKGRTGFNSYCVCLDCLSKTELDIKKDERRCPNFKSINVKTIREMVGRPCPKCGRGTVVEIDTGVMT